MIGGEDAAALSEAYVRLRTIEHRVQMIDDRQTHHLPEGEALARVARLHGLAGGDALLDLLAPHVARVAAVYDDLASDEADTLSLDPDHLAGELAELGFADAGSAAAQIAT